MPADGYTVAGDKATDVKTGGDYTLTVTGAGNYKGSATATWNITPKDITGATVTLESDQLAYKTDAAGAGVEQSVSVKEVSLGGEKLSLGTSDYDVSGNTGTDVGDYTLVLTGKGNYSGTAAGAPWKIVSSDIDPDKLEVTLAQTTYTYDGTAHEPAATVTYDGTTLSASDYKVSYADNKDAGTATATITLQGNYKAVSKDATFTIDPYALTDDNAQLSFANNGTSYTASAIQAGDATLTLKTALADGTTTLSASDYDLSGDTTGTNAATYTAKAAGKGNFTGSTSGTWEIVPAPVELSKFYVTMNPKVCTYDGTEQKPAAEVSYNNLPVAEADYTVSYSNNINAGTAKATVTLQHNYEAASKDISFTIDPYVLNALTAKLSFANSGTVYTGSPIEAGDPIATLTTPLGSADSPITTVPVSDLTVEGTTSATTAGTYNAKVSGKGNYTGTISGTWTIEEPPPVYTVTFDVGTTGCTWQDNKTIQKKYDATSGTKLAESKVPTDVKAKSGTVFVGWSTNKDDVDGSTTVYTPGQIADIEVTGNTTYYAICTTGYVVKYHANGGTGAEQVQSIAVGAKTATLRSVDSMFSAPSGKRFGFWTLGKTDTDVTTGKFAYDSLTTLTYIDGHSLAASGEEMCTDSSTSTSKTEAGSCAVVNLYAHWIDASLGSYWMAPAKKYVTGNAAAKENDDYRNPETYTSKNAETIAAEVEAIRADASCETASAWKTIMDEDKYHLYTLFKDDSALAYDDRYMEFRVVEVGAHLNSSGDASSADGSTVTFMATHSLPEAKAIYADKEDIIANPRGWNGSDMQTDVMKNYVLGNFEDDFKSMLATVSKKSINGNYSDWGDPTVTSEQAWPMSYIEVEGKAGSGRAVEGTQYTWWSGKKKAYTTLYQTRSGATPKDMTSDSIGAWYRSLNTEITEGFYYMATSTTYVEWAYFYDKLGVCPALAM